MEAISARRNVRAELAYLRTMLATMPAARRAHWARRVNALRALAGARGAVAGGATGDWGSDPEPVEWDLALANELDKIYTAVADETTRVATGVADAASAAGWSLWPFAVAAIAIGWAVGRGRFGR